MIKQKVSLKKQLLEYCDHGVFKDIVVSNFLKLGYSEEEVLAVIAELIKDEKLDSEDIDGDLMLITRRDYSIPAEKHYRDLS